MRISSISPITFKSSNTYFQGNVSARRTAFSPETPEDRTYRARKRNILKRGLLFSLVMLSGTILYFSTLKK